MMGAIERKQISAVGALYFCRLLIDVGNKAFLFADHSGINTFDLLGNDFLKLPIAKGQGVLHRVVGDLDLIQLFEVGNGIAAADDILYPDVGSGVEGISPYVAAAGIDREGDLSYESGLRQAC